MPAETHQLGGEVDSQNVLELLLALLEDPARTDGCSTLASLGVDDEGLLALWDAVCEEYAERSLGPELEPGVLRVSMTLEVASTIMAKLVVARRDDAG